MKKTNIMGIILPEALVIMALLIGIFALHYNGLKETESFSESVKSNIIANQESENDSIRDLINRSNEIRKDCQDFIN